MPPPLTYARAPGFVLRAIGSHTVLVPSEGATPDGALTLLLDGPVAVHLWEALTIPRSAQDLTDLVLAEFDVDPETASRDVTTFLAHLASLGCVFSA